MAGLPHYQNSLYSINKYEPVYLNQFEVTVIPPPAVAGGQILLEQVVNVTGLDVDKNPGFVFQKYKFAKRNYAGGKPDKTSLDLGVRFTVNLDDANSMYVFKTLRQWTDLIYNPLTGAMGIKQDYTGTIVISIFNKNGNVFRRITCRDCFPLKAIDPMELDYLNGTTLYEINMAWAVDYWEDLFT
jgi:hypothetical protein